MKILTNMHTQFPLDISKVSQKFLHEFIDLLPTADLNNQGRELQNGVRTVIPECDMPTQCLLHIVKVSSKYLSVLKLWLAQNFDNFGD